MSDFVQEYRLSSLPARQARLAMVLARPKRVALGAIIVLTAAGWLALGMMAGHAPPGLSALCNPVPMAGWSGAALAAPMWMAMTLAMMLPTAGPMIMTYAEIADTAAQRYEPVVSPLVLIAGYAAVWLGFAAVAAVLQATLAGRGLLGNDGSARLLAGAVAIGAGFYQFAPLKQACLARCQRPFPFFFSHWTTESFGVFRLGLRQGMTCLGCCWAIMLVMFAAGVMNVVWMAVLGVVMTIEKLGTTPRFSEAVGFAFVAAGFGLLLSSIL